MIVLAVPERWRRYAIVADEDDEPADETMFLAEELAARDSMTLQKRRREWTACRKALKMLAVERRAIGRPLEGLIESDGDSRPHLYDRISGRSWHVSLTHSRGLVAAAIDDQPIGIDVERVRPLPGSAAHLFLTEEEREAIEGTELADALLHGWCAKEAAWKAISSMHDTLKSVPLRLVRGDERGLTFEGPTLTIETRRISPQVVAALARTR